MVISPAGAFVFLLPNYLDYSRNEYKESMTQDEKWIHKYNEVAEFVNANHRNPSKHRIEEHNMLNWLKQQRKLLNAGILKPERVEMFKQLQEMIEQYKRKNQYE